MQRKNLVFRPFVTEVWCFHSLLCWLDLVRSGPEKPASGINYNITVELRPENVNTLLPVLRHTEAAACAEHLMMGQSAGTIRTRALSPYSRQLSY